MAPARALQVLQVCLLRPVIALCVAWSSTALTVMVSYCRRVGEISSKVISLVLVPTAQAAFQVIIFRASQCSNRATIELEGRHPAHAISCLETVPPESTSRERPRAAI